MRFLISCFHKTLPYIINRFKSSSINVPACHFTTRGHILEKVNERIRMCLEEGSVFMKEKFANLDKSHGLLLLVRRRCEIICLCRIEGSVFSGVTIIHLLHFLVSWNVRNSIKAFVDEGHESLTEMKKDKEKLPIFVSFKLLRQSKQITWNIGGFVQNFIDIIRQID